MKALQNANERGLLLAYIGLGANLGDPIAQIVAAKTSINKLPMIKALRSSAIYASSPVGYDEQPDFCNCVVEVSVSGPCPPQELFAGLQNIEEELGRVRDSNNQNAARTIDIDLLFFGDAILSEPDLVIPHPRLHQRLFVLLPLRELNPGLAQQHLQSGEDKFHGQALHRLAL